MQRLIDQILQDHVRLKLRHPKSVSSLSRWWKFWQLTMSKNEETRYIQLLGCVAIEKKHVELQEGCMRSQIREQFTEQSTLIMGNLGSYP